MKIDFLIDFLPPDLRRRSVLRVSRRRSGLLLALMAVMVVGVAAHSWNAYRTAEADRSASQDFATSSTKVDDVIDKLAADQQAITRFLSVYDQIALPLDTSDLVATLTHILPEKMSLAMIRLEVQSESPSAKDKESAKSAPKPAAKGAKTAKGAKPVEAAPPRPRKWIYATIRGYAASNNDLIDFERKLSRTSPLEGVTVTENKPTEVPPGLQLQEFAITCRIPLDARYENHGSVPVATVPPLAKRDDFK